MRWRKVKGEFLLCRHELYHIQRELLRERTHCKALEEELENPMNIHRWRKLEVPPVLMFPCTTNSPPCLQPSAGQRPQHL